ncbi:hypothetical protein L1987_56546 [Smallanthus sonchifolius]|uniref:Uncharacterized protein n=1 Tax=Smallanthus sonchifolius TaxID=185202 RepID=A0ACB9ECR4_9ASTR|nr:hypothetical protein L1987_56546 [Smallanthus sonchifolius]
MRPAIVLGIICGLPAVYKSHDGNTRGLAPWAKGCIKQGNLNDIIGRRLSGQIANKCGKDFARIACDCLHEKPHKRPKMAVVVSRLEKILSLQERLDSSMPEPKFIDKILSCFRPNTELEGDNFVLAGGSEDRPCSKVSNPVIATGQGEVLYDESASELSHISRSEGDNVRDAMVMARNDEVQSGKGKLMAFRRFYTGPLSWNLRIKVALGVAKGLAYLHKPESKVMCQDFNSTSILIDSNDNARISNFGMVKDGPVDSKSHASRQVIHTKGYADPEYIKTDSKEIEKIIDPHRDEHYSSHVAQGAALIAKRCLFEEPKCRPTAHEVVKELERLMLPE